MKGHGCLYVIAAVLSAATLAPAPVQAGEFIDRSQPPARIGNIYSGLNHEPTRGEVEKRERAARLQPDGARQSADDAEVERLFRELTR
jgi:hypothetical protein